ncbi:MAG: hypothetical protein KC910_08960 [Candidatus Eremiobacteraeota bacterium]|nr:hypothetical protein [Candidatus Eremiobacteraeota bacterium]
MIDNTQKSSDQLRTQLQRELRSRRARSTGDSSELSADCGAMDEDLLGSMDPDLFGSGSQARAFTEAWEEEDLEDYQDYEDFEERDEDEEFYFGGDDDDQPDQSQEWEQQPTALEGEVEELEDGQWHDYQADPELAEEEPESDQGDQDSQPSLPAEARAPVPPPSQEEVPAAETLELEEPESDGSEPAATQDGKWSSLLDHGDGFLLAEEETCRPIEVESDELPSSPELEVEPTLARVTGQLITGDVTSPAYARLQLLLGRFGLGVLRLCVSEKTRVHLWPAGQGLANHPGVQEVFGDEPVVGAVYLPTSRTCVIEEECLLRAPRHFHPVLFYFAHAFDHALGDSGFASLKSAAVKASFQACQEGMLGHEFSDAMAETSPVRYFAQSVEAFLSESDCADPFWTREDLYDFDRSMYDYLEYLFRRQNA